MKKQFGLIFFSLFCFQYSFGAACCGGGGGSTALILGDENHLAQISQEYKSDEYQVSKEGYWIAKDRTYWSSSFAYSTLMSDRFQSGFKINTQYEKSVQRMADSSIALSYELIQESGYGLLYPKVFMTSSISIPFGKSPYNLSSSDDESAITSLGYSKVDFSFIVYKSHLIIDYLFGFQFGHGLNTEINNQKIIPQNTYQIQGSLGYFIKDLRLATALTQAWEKTPKISAASTYPSYDRQWTTISFSIGSPISSSLAWNLNYADQGLLGSPTNTALQKTIGLNLTYKELR